MKKVFLIKNIYNKIVLPIVNGEYVCFRSKKDCQAYIDYVCNIDCFPYQLRVHPRNNHAGPYMYIDMINEGFDYDYDNGQIFSRIQWSDIVYPTIEIVKKSSGLYDDMKSIANNDEWVIGDDHIYNKYGGFNDVMDRKPEYRIYKLKIV